jgi:hypothetical protein
MTALSTASLLNNEGVRLLQEGNVLAAMRSFQQALTVIQDCSRPLDVANTDAAAAAAVATSIGCNWLPLFISQSPQKLLDVPSGSYFLYNRPFLLTPDLFPAHCDDCLVDLVGCHVLFNFALAWQQHATMTEFETSVRRTSELYDILLQISSRRVSLQFDKAFTALTCLVFNNLAHLHQELCQYSESGMCIDIMLNVLHDTQGLEDYLQPRELSGMVWNAAHIQPPDAASAA